MNHFLTVFSINKPQILLQPILVLALAVVLVSLTGAGVLGQPWNQFDVLVQDLGWSEEAITSPTLDSTLELRLTQVEGESGGGPPAPGFNNFEDFEAGFTTWVNTSGDNNDCWRRDSSGTPTIFTGPSTGAVGTTWYVYYEASDSCSPGTGSQAFLAGPIIDFDTFNDIEVTFWRHMFSATMGRLALELEDAPGSGTFTEVWFQQGNQGNQWDQITVDLSSEDNTGQRQLRFVATEVIAGVRSDMAVDEIRIQGVAAPLAISFEDFETGFTTWVNTSGDNNDCWRRDSGGTPSGNTGPSTGADGTTWYVYYEGSFSCSSIGATSYLLGPTLSFDAFNEVEVTFWRHMFGSHIGRLALELEDTPGSGTFTEVWFQQGNQGNQWDRFTVDLSSEDNTGQRQLRFVSSGNNGVRSDMAVDEITIQATAVGGTINLITSCVFHSDEDIPAASGLSQGTAICKLLDAPVDQGGNAIAEGRTFFKSYTGSDDLEVFISEFVFENSNDNELIFDIKFIIESPV